MLGKHQLVVANLAAFVAGADGTQLLEGEKARTRVHNAAGDYDRRDIDAPKSHEVRGQALVAARHKNASVKGSCLGMNLDHVRDGITAGQGVVDAIMPLRLAVADVGAKVARTVASSLCDASAGLLDKLKEARAPGVGVPGSGLDDDLRFIEVLNAPARAEAQRVHLWANLAKLAGTRLQTAHKLVGILLDFCRDILIHAFSPIHLTSIWKSRDLGASQFDAPAQVTGLRRNT